MSTERSYDFESERYSDYAGDCRDAVESEISNLEKNRFLERFFDFDHSLWGDDPEEISNRLGWVNAPEEMLGSVDEIERFSESVRRKGFTDVLVLGMGGSSLSCEVFANTFDAPPGSLQLSLLDTTDPDFILKTRKETDISKTLFVVSSKSGSTVETTSLMKYFYGELLREKPNPGENFICITDPGSGLAKTAGEHGFAKAFLNDPDIGGRFSALSYFGLVPASLAGVDVGKVLESARSVLLEARTARAGKYGENPCVRFGTFLGTLAREGRDKLRFVFSDGLFPFGCWAEQLVAESTGKDGVGILPVLDEGHLNTSGLGNDTMFALFRRRGDEAMESATSRLRDAGIPFAEITVGEPHEIGAEFFRFEFAVALAGSVMGINPFNQPDVESAKVFARKFLESYFEKGELESPESDFFHDGLVFSSNADMGSPEELKELVSSKNEGYVSIQAYVDPREENSKELLSLRETLGRISRVPVTLGFGPRFLHSTGQLHKGDSGDGLFFQIVSENSNDVPIPDDMGSAESGLSFGILKTAQATGDFRSLDEKGRTVVCIRVASDGGTDIQKVARLFA